MVRGGALVLDPLLRFEEMFAGSCLWFVYVVYGRFHECVLFMLYVLFAYECFHLNVSVEVER